MINLGLLAMPEKIDYSHSFEIPMITLSSRYTGLELTFNKYYDIFVLHCVILMDKCYGSEFYYNYKIFTNFYRRTDKKTGFDKVVFVPHYPHSIRIFLGRVYL
jgi:hypothetical protein